jgi:hypothetical protein
VTAAIQGWQPDEFQRHEKRYYSGGTPTFLVRDGAVESSDPPGFRTTAQPVTTTAPTAPVTDAPAPAPVIDTTHAETIQPPPLYIEAPAPSVSYTAIAEAPVAAAVPAPTPAPAPAPAYALPVQPEPVQVQPAAQPVYAQPTQPESVYAQLALPEPVQVQPATEPEPQPLTPASVSIDPGQTITIWVETGGANSRVAQPIVVTAKAAASLPAEPEPPIASTGAAENPVTPAAEPASAPMSAEVSAAEPPEPAAKPVATAAADEQDQMITIPVETVGAYSAPAAPIVVTAASVPAARVEATAESEPEPTATSAPVAASPAAPHDQLAAAALSIEPGQTVTIRVETSGPRAGSTDPIVVAATLSAPKIAPPEAAAAIVEHATSTVPPSPRYATEWTPPVDSHRIYQPPIYATPTYTAQLDGALQQRAAELQSAYQNLDAYALPRLTPLPETYELIAAAASTVPASVEPQPQVQLQPPPQVQPQPLAQVQPQAQVQAQPTTAPVPPFQASTPPPGPTFQPPTPQPGPTVTQMPAAMPVADSASAVSAQPQADSFGQPPAVQAEPQPPLSVTEQAKQNRRRRWFGIGAAVLVIGGVATAAIVTIGSSGGHHAAAASGTGASATGTAYSSSSGHFKARFPSKPTEIVPTSKVVGNVQVALQGAASNNPVTRVQVETASQSVATDQQQTFMQLALSAVAVPSSLTDNGEVASRYTGHVARTATFSGTDGMQLTALAFFYSDTRVYLLIAQTGTAFTNLIASFVPMG